VRKFLKALSLLLLGLWIGAAIFFGAAVAPNLFAVLRGAELSNANALAGTIVTRLLSIINRGGFEISLLLLVVGFFSTRGQRLPRRLVEMISLAIVAIMTGLGHWVVAARMSALRAAMQLPIDQVALTDPRRVEFDSLHRYSVTMMGVAILAALVAFMLIALRGQKSRREIQWK
jgi:Flp pilus assembly pilin Flp